MSQTISTSVCSSALSSACPSQRQSVNTSTIGAGPRNSVQTNARMIPKESKNTLRTDYGTTKIGESGLLKQSKKITKLEPASRAPLVKAANKKPLSNVTAKIQKKQFKEDDKPKVIKNEREVKTKSIVNKSLDISNWNSSHGMAFKDPSVTKEFAVPAPNKYKSALRGRKVFCVSQFLPLKTNSQ